MKKLKKQWKIHLVHHTHLDIGYTHTQDEVLKLQLENLRKAMEIIKNTDEYSPESQFKWNPEILWAVEHWLDNADEEAVSGFSQLVKSGRIGLDGLYANFLTGLCRPEELDKSFKIKRKIEKILDVKIDSAMITDVPGWNWGLTTLFSENGIKYLSCGTNNGDRIGYIKKAWADEPFYWVSPSGKEKTLIYVHGKGYSWFHTGPMGKNKDLSRKLNPDRISQYLYELEKDNYPYDTIIIRYNIGADNGPPDENLSDIVKAWNKKYSSMKLFISTTSQAMRDFEESYGENLPCYQGDITPYWEDGAASSARETSVARQAGEMFTQASNLSYLLSKPLDEKMSDRALKEILLFNEHTWGAYNSISKPDHEFAVSQWNWKAQHAYAALNDCVKLIEDTAGGKLLYPEALTDIIENSAPKCESEYITVHNTNSWTVSQAVEIKTDYNCVFDEQGNAVPAQKLTDGKLAFRVKDILPHTSCIYRLAHSDNIEQNHVKNSSGFSVSNGIVDLKINEKTGCISSINYKGKEFVDRKKAFEFNNYIFAKGKWGTKKIIDKSVPEISVIDNGDVLTRVRIKRKGYKTRSIITEITLYSGDDCIYITNILERDAERKKEGLHFSFPFNLPNARVKYDTIYGSAELNKDQLKGSNKNFITATRWFDVSDENCGISCALLDAPLIKVGKLVHDPIRTGDPYLCGWLKECVYDGTVYSYVMNNYWMTNYKADQEGTSVFRYVFMPHGTYSEEQTQKFAMEQMQRLLVIEGKTDKISAPFKIDDQRVIVSHFDTDDGKQVVRIFNASEENAVLHIDEETAMLSPNKTLNSDALQLAPKETVLLNLG